MRSTRGMLENICVICYLCRFTAGIHDLLLREPEAEALLVEGVGLRVDALVVEGMLAGRVDALELEGQPAAKYKRKREKIPK